MVYHQKNRCSLQNASRLYQNRICNRMLLNRNDLLSDKDLNFDKVKISVGIVALRRLPPKPSTSRLGIISPMKDLGTCPVKKFAASSKMRKDFAIELPNSSMSLLT